MTIRIPHKSTLDKLLKIIGKRRGILVPSSELYQKFGPYTYISIKKESFWTALFRPKKDRLPEGMIDIDDFK